MKKRNVEDDVEMNEYYSMEEYTELAGKYLVNNKNITKDIFKIVKTIYKGVRKGRFTLEWALKRLNAGETNRD